MAEKLDTLIHHYTFTEDDRTNLVFSDSTKILLDRSRSVVELRADSFGDFPLGADINVITAAFIPKAVRQWLGFEVGIKHVFRGTTQLTGVGYRLHNGTSQYWWNGAAWVVNTTSWNTEAEVAANIASFQAITTRTLRIVINLTTTDKRYTPTLSLAKVAFKAKIQYMEDIVYRSLVPALRDNIRYITDFAFKVVFPGGTVLDIGAALDAAGIPFNVAGMDSVFNHTADGEHLTNLLSSYNATTRKATLTTAIPVGSMAYAQLLVAPEIVVQTTSQDFTEVEKVPSLIIRDINPRESSPMNQEDYVVNKATATAIVLPPPYRFHLHFTMIALAPGAVDLSRFTDAVVEFMENNQQLRSVGLDRKYRLMLRDEFTTTTRPTLEDIHSAEARGQLFDVLAWKKPAITTGVHAIQRVNLTGDMDIVGPPT